jgi:hypothetical protein
MVTGKRPAENSATADGLIAHINVCYPQQGPLETNKIYLAAALPEIDTDSDGSPEVTRLLYPGTGANDQQTEPYALQAVIPPTGSGRGYWMWTSSTVRTVTGSTSDQLNVTAVNSPAQQRDTRNAFYSGIAFGIAGAAGIGVFQELLTPIRIKSRRKQPGDGSGEPSGGNP